MAALGQQLFSKELTTTDVDHRLHWPAEHLSELPSFTGHQVDFTAKDIDGRVWKFRCSKRMTGDYNKPVISAGWVPFLRSKGVIRAGDGVIFYRSTEPDAHFAIRFKRRILFFGSCSTANKSEMSPNAFAASSTNHTLSLHPKLGAGLSPTFPSDVSRRSRCSHPIYELGQFRWEPVRESANAPRAATIARGGGCGGRAGVLGASVAAVTQVQSN